MNISDPRHPLPSGEFRTREQVFALMILDNLAYVVGWAGTGLQIVSITNGNQLRGIGSSPLPEDGQGVYVVDFRRQPLK